MPKPSFSRILRQRPVLPDNRISRNKLPGSKWTACEPLNQEKHFVVHDWVAPGSDELEMEAIHSHRFFTIHWKALKNSQNWQMGWH
ncbi:TIGR02450 family Trp-rich protein [bacterium (Candidatus Blackallbacteria) CG17_big_fil_post_rev_8_21_14_2_50_48_46]|uniref:TIGR02450 family Trp-rich protein n=1 Tax=bacterium (Candidatus Blackallbacteria) CG17_big_fil_post_rev_8_21_14_2_50_48_46 TaxID=2014261 RepID=A0A2M7G1K8_9BACT|nr:MAG: TIGR02450 family Trp-rich protein [bacterium (Candidatus Blackallbacteria) CG18_big_fil_WC_8_21_14_2_50_49_26]PIW15621.1 MAG: TIGR02450 family Trp-rich protein [bacterium (Candidatus Blackallbacteria) CG17_big_fil_post_rev_8_21_14_2_50_48_46]PIW48105.1 MAG: TIGR02450 family Trp-rich protein [bacterium (Candidatus Blackallbacteria) CG13_big_fil_rev_8_21_14_2_50_49_14]